MLPINRPINAGLDSSMHAGRRVVSRHSGSLIAGPVSNDVYNDASSTELYTDFPPLGTPIERPGKAAAYGGDPTGSTPPHYHHGGDAGTATPHGAAPIYEDQLPAPVDDPAATAPPAVAVVAGAGPGATPSGAPGALFTLEPRLSSAHARYGSDTDDEAAEAFNARFAEIETGAAAAEAAVATRAAAAAASSSSSMTHPSDDQDPDDGAAGDGTLALL